MITLPAAFIFLGVAAGSFGTFDLGFVALPNVFAMMPGGRFFGFLWFFMLFLAAITSSVSMLQPVIAFLEEGFGLRRHASVALLGMITAFGAAFVLYFSKGLVALDTFDFWVGTFLIYVLAMVQAILYGWVLGIDRGEAEAHEGANLRIPRLVQYVLKYVTPTYLIVIFAAFCWDSLPSKFVSIGNVETVSYNSLAAGAVPQEVGDFLESRQLEVSPEAYTEFGGSLWGGRDLCVFNSPDGPPTYVVRPAESGIEIDEIKNGYIANILADETASLAVSFMAVLCGFLLLLVHIAGRRWEAAGLFASDGD